MGGLLDVAGAADGFVGGLDFAEALSGVVFELVGKTFGGNGVGVVLKDEFAIGFFDFGIGGSFGEA